MAELTTSTSVVDSLCGPLNPSGPVLELLPCGRRFSLDDLAAFAAACRNAFVARTISSRKGP
jgi:hypothetical protein